MKENSNEIWENIKDIEKYISFTSERQNFSHDTDWNWNKDLANKIEHILSDYKRVLKENEELKNLIAHKNAYTKMLEKDLFENCSNYVISRQKIKDKIEEYKNILKTCNKAKDVDRIKAINERVLELEELLEKNEEESKCPKKQENKNSRE